MLEDTKIVPLPSTSVSTVMFDVPRLIEEVKRRPALWDHEHPHRHNRSVLDVLWEEVARPFGVPADDARRKWKGLRDTFRKELKKYPNGFETDIPMDANQPSWIFFRPLYFLKGQMRARRMETVPDYILDVTTGEGGGENGNSTGDIIDMSSDVCDPVDLSESILKQAEDEDYHFFMSLIPHVRRLHPLRKLQLRAKMQDLICREVYGSELMGDSPISVDENKLPIDPLL